MNWKKAKKSEVPELPKAKPPRGLEEIQKEHDETISKAGIVQYQIEVLKQQLFSLNNLLMQLNNEGARSKEQADRTQAENKRQDLSRNTSVL